MQFAYGMWRPDQAGPGGGLTTAEGVIPQASSNGIGHGPFPQMISTDGSEALSGTPRGIISAQAPDGTWSVFAATASKIEKLSSTFTWDDVETGRTVPTGYDVSFSLFQTKLINTDHTDGMKAYDIVAGGANTAISAAPAARACFVCGNSIFALGTNTEPRRFANSDIGSHTRWSGGSAEGKTLDDGGNLIGGADLNNGIGLMFQQRAIRAIQWGGSTYSVTKIADGLGCVAERTIVPYNGMVAFWNDDGPWLLRGAGAAESIGAEKINRWAAEHIGRQNFANLQGTVDPERKLFLWRIDSSEVLAFSWQLGEFSLLPHNTAALARIATPAVTVDSLSGTVDSLSGTVDSLGGSSAPLLGGLNTSLKYATFTGQNMAATLETRPANNPVTGLVGRATPIDDANAGTLQIGVADRLDSTLTWKTGAGKVASGRVPLRARGLNVAFRRNITAGTTWTYANGIDHIQTAQGGPR